MKHILVTDTHLGYKDGSTTYHKIVIDLFNDIVDYAEINNIKSIIHGGDFFDCRRAISVKTIPIAFNIIDLLSKSFDYIHIIVGNHDTYFKTELEPTSLNMFVTNDKINIIKKPIVFRDIHLQPWLIDDFEPIDTPYLFGHFEMCGIPINRVGTISKSGISAELFKEYDVVLSGHYHTKSVTGNIQYLGSPFHMTFNDEGKRGFYVFDDSDGSLEFVEFDKYPKFIVFNHEDIDKSKIEGNNIKIVITKDLSTTEINSINNNVYDLNPNQLFIDFDFDRSLDITADDNIDMALDTRTLESKYLDNIDIPDHIKRNELEEHLDKLWKKMM